MAGLLDFAQMAQQLGLLSNVAAPYDPKNKGLNPLATTEGIRPYAGGANPGTGARTILEHGGNRYEVRPIIAADGQTGHLVRREVKTASGGTTWRTLSGYGRANHRNELANVLDLFKGINPLNTTEGARPYGGGSFSAQARAAKSHGLELNQDGTVTLYHGTTPQGAAAIRQTGTIRSAGEPHIYLTTAKTGTGYGGPNGVSVPVRVDPRQLMLDDQFPDGRMDFSIPGKVLRVLLGE